MQKTVIDKFIQNDVESESISTSKNNNINQNETNDNSSLNGYHMNMMPEPKNDYFYKDYINFQNIY